ncbi:protein-L-isoaspartate carboxylmethyltransferase [Microbacterium thalassium]|nr:protein-L-isoaspartate carboxylmethyltransferase [Microbacterium thalassium]
MPYRDRATVDAWLREFHASNPDIVTQISVLDQEFTAGPESGLVVVSLRNASTVTYVQPVMRDGEPVWIVTFEARSDSIDLDAGGVADLAQDLDLLARICGFLQSKTDAAVAAKRRVVES